MGGGGGWGLSASILFKGGGGCSEDKNLQISDLQRLASPQLP